MFYKKNSFEKEIIICSEPIRFLPYDSMKSDFNVRKVVFQNSEIWIFLVVKKNCQKRLYLKLEKDSLGMSKVLINCGIITDRKLRKKEFNTFYVIAK